jgi:DNA-binding NarL/FixJ family response regulator
VIRVLLCDDQELVRAGFRLILDLSDDLEVVGEAVDGKDCLRQVALLRPDVVLMDIRMPRMDGVEATRQLVAAGSTARVLVLTTFDLDEHVYDAMRAGASGFLLKDVPREQLVFAVRAVARGDAFMAPALTRRLVERYVGAPAPTSPNGVPARLEALSERERDVFARLARGCSNTEIAEELVLGEATVKTHVGNILAKLDLRDRVQAVVLAYESGFVTPGR